MGGLLRLKGFAWLATRPERQAQTALAGTQFTVVPGPPWLASIPLHLWPEGLAEELQAQREEQEAAEEAGLERDPPDASRVSMWEAEHGDRRTDSNPDPNAHPNPNANPNPNGRAGRRHTRIKSKKAGTRGENERVSDKDLTS